MIATKEQQVPTKSPAHIKRVTDKEMPAPEKPGVLPPSNGLPSAARAASMIAEVSGPPDVATRARMSVALQQSIGNARTARLLTVAPAAVPTEAPPPVALPPARAAQPAVKISASLPAQQLAPVEPPATKPAAPAAVTPVLAPAPKTPILPVTMTSAPAAPAPAPAPAAAKTAAAPEAPKVVPAPVAATPTPATLAVPPAPSGVTKVGTAVPVIPAPALLTIPPPPPTAAAPAALAKPTATAATEAAAPPAAPAPIAAPTATAAAEKGATPKAAPRAPGVVASGVPGKESAAAGAPAKGGREIKLKMPEPPAGLSPAAHARIHRVQVAAGHAAAAHAALPSSGASVRQARAAVTEPPQETQAHAQQDLVVALGERPKPSPEIEQLCADIVRIIKSKRPPDEESLVKADPKAMGEAAGGQLNNKVQGDSQRVASSYDQMNQSPQGTPQQQAQPMEAPPETADSPPINADEATPDPVPAEDVSLDADAEASQSEMDQAGMNSDAAKLVQTGPIAEARKAQGELEQTAKEDPAKVLAEQKKSLAKASSDMAALQQSALAALAGSRRATVSGTVGQQKHMVGSEEQMRATVSAQAQSIFTTAQSKVNSLLQPLQQTAMSKWDKGVAVASEEFKQQLNKVDDWIKERHGGGWGAIVSAWDWLTGLPGWVTDEYDKAEQKFGDDICNLAREISTDVNGVVMACEAVIQDARTSIHQLFTSLPANLQSWAAGEESRLGAQLDALHDHAIQTRDNFNKDLVNKASQSVQDVRQQIYALRLAAGGLIGQIKDAVGRFLRDPAKFILEGLLQLLGIPPAAFWAVVDKIKHVVKDIADDPLKFAHNLLKALGQGFSQFFDHILDHLLKGFINWLTGSLGQAGVTLPKDLSLKSIITFMLQLMGITWPRIRKLLAKHIGEKNVALIEKAYSIVANLVALGPEGVFEMIKEKLNPAEILKQIIHAAVDYLVKAVIKAVATRIILLFNPVGAILQALEAIYKVLKWIFTNAARIFHLVETVVNGIADIIAGNIGGMANAVENALAGLIPPVIDFLADYLGFGDLPDKIKDTIISFQNWIEGILDKVIGWLVEKGKALLAAVGLGGDKDKDKDKDKSAGQVGKDVSWTVNNESHHLWIEIEGKTAIAKMASGVAQPVLDALDLYDGKADELKEEDPVTAAEVKDLLGQARTKAAALNAAASELAEEEAKPESSEQEKPEKGEAEEKEVETEEDSFRELIYQIQTKLGLNDDEQIKKAREAFGHRLFSTGQELAPLLQTSERTAQRRTSKWIGAGILFRLQSAESDPLGLCTFDPIRAGQRETDPNNRFKYGYVNPDKASSIGLTILTKGLRADSPPRASETEADYHRNKARYDSMRPGSSYKDFKFPVAVLGHKNEMGASDHWNLIGHTQSRSENIAWNRDPDNYQGPEHEIESAMSGPGSARYKIPSKLIGSNDEWL